MKETELLGVGKPLVCSFRALADALAPYHRWERHWVDSLHDIWKQGAPTPDSIIRTPRGYDERKDQRKAGNFERRIVFPTPLAQWLQQVTRARGEPLAWRQCLNIVEGRTDYGLDLHRE